MAPSKAALDLNAMISADRQRRKNAALAQDIFGKNRRQSAPGAGVSSRKPGAVGSSLASRIGVAGITKRSISTSTRPRVPVTTKPAAGNVNAEWTHDLHSLNNPTASDLGRLAPPRGPRSARGNRNDQLHAALNGSASSPALNSQFNILGSSKPVNTTIRGLAGPYIVIAKNLAHGTTAADVESALSPIGGVILNCRLIAQTPKVIAEIIFETKEGADNVVDTVDGQNADGNILQVYHKPGPIPASVNLSRPQAPAITSTPPLTAPLGPRADAYPDRSDESRPRNSVTDRYVQRGRSRDRRRDDVLVDGSYGFDDHMDTDDRDDKGKGGLYSDNLISNRGRGGSRDRGRGGDRGRGYR